MRKARLKLEDTPMFYHVYNRSTESYYSPSLRRESIASALFTSPCAVGLVPLARDGFIARYEPV